MRQLKNLIWNILIKLGIGGAVQLLLTGELKENGWFNSFNKKESIDKNGNPLPWNTYPFIKFIEPRLSKELSVFEFGGGNSTIWLAKRVGSIYSVEHDKEWADSLQKKIPSNAKIVYKNLTSNGEYSKEVISTNKKYHIIIIDGRDRVNCIKNSINCLTDDGVIIFDNSDLIIYNEAIKLLKDYGFKKLDFFGMSPITPHTNCTSIFYKSNNCLNI